MADPSPSSSARGHIDFSEQTTADDARRYIEMMNDGPIEPADRLANAAAMVGMERRMCERFRILREERGWSQAELSERLADFGIDMHQTTIAKMESGKRALRVAEMFALGHTFGMPAGAVFFMEDSPSPSLPMDKLNEAIAEKQQLMERHKEEVLNVIDYFIETSADLQTKRNELVRLMREGGASNG